MTKPNLREWGKLWKLAALVNVNGFAVAMAQYGILLLMSIGMSNSDIGLYSWSFLVAGQAAYLVSGSLNGVFLPTYGAMHLEPERQRAAFVRSSFTMSVVLAPACGILAVLSRVLIHVCFADRWLQAHSIVSILSIGFITQPVVATAQSLLMARNRYGTVVIGNGVLASFVLMTGAMALTGPPLWFIAILHAIALTLGAVTFCLLALASDQSSLVTTLRVVLLPILICLPAMVVGFGVQGIVEVTWLKIPCVFVSFMFAYLLMLRVCAVETMLDIRTRVFRLLSYLPMPKQIVG
jgi:O-antigen/teichoic acid export membrane protein